MFRGAGKPCIMMTLLSAVAACALGADSARDDVARDKPTRAKRGDDVPPRRVNTSGAEPRVPPWLGRRDQSHRPTRNQLFDDARFVCNAKCTEDALVAHVDRCLLMGKVTVARVSKSRAGQFTAEQRDMFNWLGTPEGQAARRLDPQTYDEFDKEVLGFAFRDEEEALKRRMDNGYEVRTREDLQVRLERYWDWSKEVCQGVLGEPESE